MPFAFRVCRKSCGYCSNGSDKAGAIYDIKIATDPSRCNNPSYGLALPRKISENARTLENRYTKTSTTVTTTEMPTTLETTTEPCTKASTVTTTTTESTEAPPTTIPDFFVVTDQNYIDADDTQINDFEEWWSKRKAPYHLRLFKSKP
uniref:ShKT domain-containing protein n=1 Tax=Panagrolaimus sp. ES5 TaxID=591445 RepID=A0AC34FWU8_9BILA